MPEICSRMNQKVQWNYNYEKFPTFLGSRTPKQKRARIGVPQEVFNIYYFKLFILHSIIIALIIRSFKLKIIPIKVSLIYEMLSCFLVKND